ncbi:DUF3099 domain-containing protein [Actinophytocola algeriensis]|uniref:DUF3099 domain-containing protein n=1 Tax=Actinophytocola algeriensis TaxID=1768010 RepID=A0A7W7Q3J5_9PSEU|nr:DUF3099 domain-containing protein [Actinophytocola algeriensis]MBB4906233.1 hypothetical protein [Actinophytocola algeriensis]MBE1472082.1 hypothetical protein [Actinophytocola algeriensis]
MVTADEDRDNPNVEVCVKHERDREPVLITEAAPSHEEEQAARKRKYLTIMLVRISCLAIAGVLHSTWWLALALALLSIPLPWIAVLIANDRPPRRRKKVNRYQRSATAIDTGDHPVIDS